MKRIMLTAALIALAGSAAAIEPMHSETSNPGESLDAFSHRIAKRAVDESLRVSGEICGEFRREGEVYAITFYTIRHQTQCSYLKQSGLNYTGLTYHTHIFIGLANPHLESQKRSAPRFSAADYAHPGYMTTGNVVVFQDGTMGSQRRVPRQ